MKTQNTWIRLLLLMLVSVLLLTVFAGCKDDTETEDTGTREQDTSEGLYDADGYLKDTLPSNLDFNFDNVTILGWNSQVSEFDINDMEGDEIEDALFERDSAVEERIKVELAYTITTGDASHISDYKTTVQNACLNGKPYDITAAHTRSIAYCATGGLLADLGNMEGSYVDWDAPWWNQTIREKTMVGNSFFFTTGDIAPSYVQMLYCVYFNADIIEARGLTSPYDHVANNTWTLETMMGMTSNFYQDLNDNNQPDENDQVPVIGSYYDWPALLHGCDIGNVVRDDATGTFIIDPNLIGEKALGIMNSLTSMVVLDNCILTGGAAANRTSFISEKSMFALMESSVAARYFSEVTFEYGCVPCPKYDADQESYICAARQPTSLFGVSYNIGENRFGIVTATLEALASEGYRSVTPVIFDQIMKYQKASSQEMSDMLVLIRDSGWYDCGRIYAADISYLCDAPGTVLRDYPTQTWEGYINGTLNTTIKAKVEKLNETLLKLATE